MDIITFLDTVNIDNYQELTQQCLTFLNNRDITLNTRKNEIIRYRRAIKNTITNHQLRDNILSILEIDDSTYLEIDHQFKSNLREKLSNKISIDSDKLITRAIENIDNKSYADQCNCLALLTGRRPNELLLNGSFYHGQNIDYAIKETEKLLIDRQFESVNTPNQIYEIMSKYHNSDDLTGNYYLLFNGQSKQRDAKYNLLQPYPIPLLADKKIIMENLSDLRDKTNFKEKITLTEIDIKKGISLNTKLDKRCQKTLSESSKKLFSDLLPDSSPSELRACYAVIAHYINHGDSGSMDKNLYIGQILGHKPSAMSASFSYTNYQVID